MPDDYERFPEGTRVIVMGTPYDAEHGIVTLRQRGSGKLFSIFVRLDGEGYDHAFAPEDLEEENNGRTGTGSASNADAQQRGLGETS